MKPWFHRQLIHDDERKEKHANCVESHWGCVNLRRYHLDLAGRQCLARQFHDRPDPMGSLRRHRLHRWSGIDGIGELEAVCLAEKPKPKRFIIENKC